MAIGNLAIPSVLLFISLGFLSSLCWTLVIYFKMRSVLWPRDGSGGLGVDFSAVASRHGQLSQLWFSIAITVLLGAVIFAIFQISLMTCEDVYKIHSDTDNIEHALNALNGARDNLEGAGVSLKEAAHNLSGIDDT